MPFDIETGKSKISFSGENYGTLTADYLLEKMKQDKTVVAIRVPCNGVISDNRDVDKDYSNINKYKTEQKGNKVAIIALGDFYQLGEKIASFYGTSNISFIS